MPSTEFAWVEYRAVPPVRISELHGGPGGGGGGVGGGPNGFGGGGGGGAFAERVHVIGAPLHTPFAQVRVGCD